MKNTSEKCIEALINSWDKLIKHNEVNKISLSSFNRRKLVCRHLINADFLVTRFYPTIVHRTIVF